MKNELTSEERLALIRERNEGERREEERDHNDLDYLWEQEDRFVDERF